MLYRHATHTQVLMPLDVPAVVAVAPPDVAMDSASDVDAVTAFVLRPLQAVVLAPGDLALGAVPRDRGRRSSSSTYRDCGTRRTTSAPTSAGLGVVVELGTT